MQFPNKIWWKRDRFGESSRSDKNKTESLCLLPKETENCLFICVVILLYSEMIEEWICINWMCAVCTFRNAQLHMYTLVIKFRNELPIWICSDLVIVAVRLCVFLSHVLVDDSRIQYLCIEPIVFSIRFDYSKVHSRNFAF